MDNLTKVSVVIPVYNAAEFLGKTLNDITGQTLEEIEIICVDDGSTDNSVEIIKQWMQEDERIQLITQKNQYAGVARNNGFSKATGKYVVFWDSDDSFDKTTLEKLYFKMEETEADICVCGAQRYDMENDKYISSKAYLRTELLPQKEVFSKKDTEYLFDFATNNPWNKMYLSDFIRKNQLFFQDIKQANDTYFTMMALFLAEKITYVDEVLITYFVNNENSLTGKVSDTVFCVYDAYVYTKEKLKTYPEFALVEKSFFNHALEGFLNALNNQRNFAGYKALYDKLAQEGFSYLGMDITSVENYIHAWQYRDMMKIMSMPAEEFMLQKSTERRLNADRLRAAKEKQQKTVKKLQNEKIELEEEIARLQLLISSLQKS